MGIEESLTPMSVSIITKGGFRPSFPSASALAEILETGGSETTTGPSLTPAETAYLLSADSLA